MTKLESTTGYLQNNITLDVYDHAIYLGNIDSKNNYKEISKAEYDQRLIDIAEEMEGHLYD